MTTSMEYYIEEHDPCIVRCAYCGKVLNRDGSPAIFCFKHSLIFPFEFIGVIFKIIFYFIFLSKGDHEKNEV